jgi:hypothetical protein
MTPEGFEVGPYREVFKVTAGFRAHRECGIRTHEGIYSALLDSLTSGQGERIVV